MKHIFYIFTFLAFSLSLSAQQPVKPLLTKITATWCPNCGTWGWTAMKDLVDRLDGDKATVMALHFSGDLADDLNMELASNFPAVGQPIFQNNGTDLNFTSSTYASKLDDLVASLDTETDMINAFNIQNATAKSLASGGFEFSIPIEVDASNLEEGDYSLGLYYVRDDIVASQSGQSGQVEHFKIVDRSFSEDIYGGAYSLPGTYTSTYATSDPSIFTNDGKQEVVAILWKNDGDNHTVVTTDSSPIAILSSTEELTSNALEANVYQNAMNQIEVNLTESGVTATSATANLYSITGRQLDSQSIQNDKAYFESNSLLGNGLYIVTIESAGQFKSYKVTIK